MGKVDYRRQVLIAFVPSSFGLAALISAIVTFLDWNLNYSGLFRSENATNWVIVIETYLSWLFPLIAWLLPIFLILSFVWIKLLSKGHA